MGALSGGSSLAAGRAGITSANGRYTPALQANGDLTVTDGSGAVAWSTGTAGRGVARADMQADGNFVLVTADNGVVWTSDTDAPGGVPELQDDRNLVPTRPAGRFAWSPNSYIGESDKAALDAAEAAGRARPHPPGPGPADSLIVRFCLQESHVHATSLRERGFPASRGRETDQPASTTFPSSAGLASSGWAGSTRTV